MAYVSMAYILMAHCSHASGVDVLGLMPLFFGGAERGGAAKVSKHLTACIHGLYSYGLCGHGPYSYGLYSYGPHSYG